VENLTAAIQAGIKDPSVYYHLGLTYMKTGEQPKARDAFRQALALNPNFEKAAEIKSIINSP